LLLHVAVALFVVAAWFGSLELRGLFIPDEGRYAEIPREMLATGDWITPRLNDLKYFEKPPLEYWMTALSFREFGEDEWTARLPSAMLGFFAMLMVGYTGCRLWDARTGALAATTLGSSWGYFLAGQYLTLDMTLIANDSWHPPAFLVLGGLTILFGNRSCRIEA
jgi:4-amino-4-deoxy-L-arabinose transferase-like glycosyltransferase